MPYRAHTIYLSHTVIMLTCASPPICAGGSPLTCAGGSSVIRIYILKSNPLVSSHAYVSRFSIISLRFSFVSSRLIIRFSSRRCFSAGLSFPLCFSFPPSSFHLLSHLFTPIFLFSVTPPTSKTEHAPKIGQARSTYM
ncbi:hypothetical protein BJ138DRAFT_1166792, partial [Hygrophoropsis aurantiaca]